MGDLQLVLAESSSRGIQLVSTINESSKKSPKRFLTKKQEYRLELDFNGHDRHANEFFDHD
jgi:hypothetical protein